MNGLLPQHPDTELHVILDNVHFHYTPTHASWLNQIEVWSSILTRAVLLHLSSTTPREVCQAIDLSTDARNEHPVPFERAKNVVHPGGLRHRYADLCG